MRSAKITSVGVVVAAASLAIKNTLARRVGVAAGGALALYGAWPKRQPPPIARNAAMVQLLGDRAYDEVQPSTFDQLLRGGTNLGKPVIFDGERLLVECGSVRILADGSTKEIKALGTGVLPDVLKEEDRWHYFDLLLRGDEVFGLQLPPDVVAPAGPGAPPSEAAQKALRSLLTCDQLPEPIEIHLECHGERKTQVIEWDGARYVCRAKDEADGGMAWHGTIIDGDGNSVRPAFSLLEGLLKGEEKYGHRLAGDVS